MKITVEKEVGKIHFQGILIIEGTTEVQATVDKGQDQEKVEEIELGVLSVQNMIILQKITLQPKEEREIEQIQHMLNLDEGQTSLKH